MIDYKEGEYIPQDLEWMLLASGRFLVSNEADTYPMENAFFSASVKSVATLPMFVVTNYRKSADGSQSIECSESLQGEKSAFGFVFGVSGLMDETEYVEQERNGTCFGMPIQNPDVDYNWYAIL